MYSYALRISFLFMHIFGYTAKCKIDLMNESHYKKHINKQFAYENNECQLSHLSIIKYSFVTKHVNPFIVLLMFQGISYATLLHVVIDSYSVLLRISIIIKQNQIDYEPMSTNFPFNRKHFYIHPCINIIPHVIYLKCYLLKLVLLG